MLTKKDEKIINQLKKNSRESIRNIAKKTGIRPSTVHSRMKKLKDEGVISRFTVKLDNISVGESLIVYMLIASDDRIENKAFNDRHIKEVFGVTGEYDLLLKMKFADVSEFNEFIIRFRDENRLKKTLTMVSTICIKEEI